MSRLAQAERAHEIALSQLASMVSTLCNQANATPEVRSEVADLFVELGYDNEDVLEGIAPA